MPCLEVLVALFAVHVPVVRRFAVPVVPDMLLGEAGSLLVAAVRSSIPISLKPIVTKSHAVPYLAIPKPLGHHHPIPAAVLFPVSVDRALFLSNAIQCRSHALPADVQQKTYTF
jgi:hypothetical protein